MKQILYDISDKLYYCLSEIKENLEKREGMVISLNDLIEEAILSHFKINLLDLNDDIEDVEIIDDMILSYNYCVYAFFDLSNKNKINIGIDKFDYQPFYIGMGESNRYKNTVNRNESVEKMINKLKETDSFGFKVLRDGLSKSEAAKYEAQYISLLGRVDKMNGCLLNKNNGNCNIKPNNCKDLDLDRQLGIHILKILNKYKTKKKAANALNISERTLYRKIKLYGIERDLNQDGKVYVFKDSS